MEGSQGHHDLKAIYRTETAEAAGTELDRFEAEWGKRYPAIGPAWRRARVHVVPLFAFPPAIRKMIYTTNAVESLNRSLRKIIKTRELRLALHRETDTFLGFDIIVSHLPPSISKWDKIVHRLFSFISQNWRAKSLVSYRVIVELISATTTKTGLTVRCEFDTSQYPSGIVVSDRRDGRHQTQT